MSEPWRNKRRFAISTFIFAAPLLPIFAYSYFYSHTGQLSIPAFVIAATFEFLIATAIYLGPRMSLDRAQNGRWRKKILWSEYALRTALGLPLTIYLAASFPWESVALLRFLPSLLLLQSSRPLSPCITFLLFHSFGLIVFSAMARNGFPAPGIWIHSFTSAALGLLSISRRSIIFSLEDRIRHGRRREMRLIRQNRMQVVQVPLDEGTENPEITKS